MGLKKAGDLQDRDTAGRFAAGTSGNPAGRPKGGQNWNTRIGKELLSPLLPEAIKKLKKAVKDGQKWAIEMTISYSIPKPKPVDVEELEEFEERLAKLEEKVRN